MRAPRPTSVEWVVLAMLLCAAIWFAAGHSLLGRVDRTLYDAGLAMWRRPPPGNIVIVAVDEESLAALGRWPWRRALHATLVEKLAAAKPAAIALDLILAEPEQDPAGDEALARAIAAAGNVVLASPVAVAPGAPARDVLPLPAFRDVAAALGHIHVEYDEDGVVRQLRLVDGAAAVRPYLGLAALQVAGLPHPGASGIDPRRDSWLIPYFGGEATVPRHSYLSVLRGDVPAAAFAGKVVFLGTTASGLGDTHPSPAGGRTAPMAGIEIAAQIAGALQEGAQIRAASRHWIALVSAALALALLALYRVLRPRASLVAAIAAFVMALSLSLIALRALRLWIPPSTALAGVVLSYPLWTWRRLEAALRYMRGELGRLRAEPAVLPAAGRPALGRALQDPIDATIAPLEEAIAALRDARRFVADVVESLPQALIVTDASGRVVLANSLARRWSALETSAARAAAGLAPAAALRDCPIEHVLLDFRLPGSRTWESVIDGAMDSGAPTQVEARGPGGRDLLMLFSPCYRASGESIGLIVNMVDVSERREAERRREDLMRLLSHDMRAPQASIITLLEMREMDASAVDADTLIKRVGSLARRTLDLADDFLRLARAEQAREEEFRELDLADVVAEACDEAWTPARARAMRIERILEVDEAPVMGDRTLLLRALGNLLGNAVKYSPEGSAVTVSLAAQGVSWLVKVTDRGRGIAKEDLPRLFKRFGRVASRGKEKDPGGVGLGLVMVRTVVERHRGIVSVASEPGKGSTFSVSLPALRRRTAP